MFRFTPAASGELGRRRGRARTTPDESGVSTDERNARSFERTIEKTREEEARFSSCLRPFAVVITQEFFSLPRRKRDVNTRDADTNVRRLSS